MNITDDQIIAAQAREIVRLNTENMMLRQKVAELTAPQLVDGEPEAVPQM